MQSSVDKKGAQVRMDSEGVLVFLGIGNFGQNCGWYGHMKGKRTARVECDGQSEVLEIGI